jgi:hypothetical protein
MTSAPRLPPKDSRSWGKEMERLYFRHDVQTHRRRKEAKA